MSCTPSWSTWWEQKINGDLRPVNYLFCILGVENFPYFDVKVLRGNVLSHIQHLTNCTEEQLKEINDEMDDFIFNVEYRYKTGKNYVVPIKERIRDTIVVRYENEGVTNERRFFGAKAPALEIFARLYPAAKIIQVVTILGSELGD